MYGMIFVIIALATKTYGLFGLAFWGFVVDLAEGIDFFKGSEEESIWINLIAFFLYEIYLVFDLIKAIICLPFDKSDIKHYSGSNDDDYDESPNTIWVDGNMASKNYEGSYSMFNKDGIHELRENPNGTLRDEKTGKEYHKSINENFYN